MVWVPPTPGAADGLHAGGGTCTVTSPAAEAGGIQAHGWRMPGLCGRLSFQAGLQMAYEPSEALALFRNTEG